MLVYTREFLLICDHLKQAKTTEKKGYLIVEKAIVEALMNQNAYDTAANKLKIWKALHWIDTDEDRVTRRVHIAGSYITAVKIDLAVYRVLKDLSEL